MSRLAGAIRARLARGGKAFVPYVTGGLPGVDADLLREIEAAGADALEVGIPFSDPMMDGPVIQEASRQALEAEATPGSVLATVAAAHLAIPVIAMTYLNPVLARGEGAFLAALAMADVAGVIVPDLPVDEGVAFAALCREAAISPVFLAAPGTEPERLRAVADASDGFVYCVSTYGVTGTRDALAGSSRAIVGALRPLTDEPLLVGVGISTPEQAAEACTFADGVVVGSALMRPLLEGDRSAALALVRGFREAIPIGS